MPHFSHLSKNEKLVLNELLTNARASDSDICKATGLSRSTVTKVRKKLEDEHVIDAYISYPNMGQAVFAFTAYRWTNFSDEEEKQKFESYVAARTDVAVFLKGSGFKGSTHLIVSIHSSLPEYEQSIAEIREKAKQNGEVLDAFVSSRPMQIKSFGDYIKNMKPE